MLCGTVNSEFKTNWNGSEKNDLKLSLARWEIRKERGLFTFQANIIIFPNLL